MRIRKICMMAVLSLSMLSGCVYPTKKTYYTPTVTDASIDKTRCVNRNSLFGCTYNNDVFRNIKGVRVKVTISEQYRNVVAIILSYKKNQAVEIDPMLLEVQSNSSIYKPTKVISNREFEDYFYSIGRTKAEEQTDRYMNLYNRPEKYSKNYITRIIKLNFPNRVKQLKEIAFIFPQGMITLNGQSLNIPALRFKKVEKYDMSFLIIND